MKTFFKKLTLSFHCSQYFAIQNHKECWSGSDDKVDYDKHGKSDKCTDGTGGPWSNDVYEIAGGC